MSRISTERWNCDGCSKDGGVVNLTATIPNGWLSMRVRVGVEQTRFEQEKEHLVHYCQSCAEHWLLQLADQGDIHMMRALFDRVPKGILP